MLNDSPPKRRASPSQILDQELRAALEPFYIAMGGWNERLTFLLYSLGKTPARPALLDELRTLRRDVEEGRQKMIDDVTPLSIGKYTPRLENAQRASAQLLAKIESLLTTAV